MLERIKECPTLLSRDRLDAQPSCEQACLHAQQIEPLSLEQGQ